MSAKTAVRSELRQYPVTNLGIFGEVVPKEGFEPTHPYGYYVLNVARLPFRHFGTSARILTLMYLNSHPVWWAIEDSNL